MKMSRPGTPGQSQHFADHGADLNARDSKKSTPLFAATVKGHPDVIKKLLLLGADPTLKNCQGRTALMVAEKMENKELMDLLSKEAHGE